LFFNLFVAGIFNPNPHWLSKSFIGFCIMVFFLVPPPPPSQ
jgi:hypothetical protein